MDYPCSLIRGAWSYCHSDIHAPLCFGLFVLVFFFFLCGTLRACGVAVIQEYHFIGVEHSAAERTLNFIHRGSSFLSFYES